MRHGYGQPPHRSLDPTFRHEDALETATRVLTPRGELDHFAVRDFRHAIASAIGKGTRRVVVDLSHTTFVDTSAIAALVDGSAMARREGSALAVVSPPDSRLRVIFRLTHVDRVLVVCESLDEALAT